MIENGFEFSELSQFKKDCLEKMQDWFPQETKKFLKKSTGDLTRLSRKRAKQEVGTTGNAGDKSYHKRFKTGKVFIEDGEFVCRNYNAARHGHLIENGHRQLSKEGKLLGFTPGKNILAKSEIEFKSQYYSELDKFLGDYFEELLKK